LPSGADLNNIIVQGIYYGAGSDTIANKPSGMNPGKNFILEVRNTSDTSSSIDHRLTEMSTSAVSPDRNEWIRSGFNSSGTVTWGAWRRIITDVEYNAVRTRFLKTNTASTTWVKLLEVASPTTSGNAYGYAISFTGGQDDNPSNQATGQLQFFIRNTGGSTIQHTEKVMMFGATSANSLQFGYTFPTTIPGSTFTIYVKCAKWMRMNYTNFGEYQITTEGNPIAFETTEPTGWTAITPTALATA
jgi:hypothetical protein